MNPKNTKFLKPATIPVELEGKMIYNESQRAWGVLRLRKEIISEFPQLKERRKKIGYRILFCRDIAELDKQMEHIKKNIGIAPMLVWFVKE